ncbi:hypothetical protein [uncultured Helicobacter sp.]|uniref:hypothetical protein n=1 Tax=uncultured Helicobacter sp. TaxID=175537 RepID=UPI002597FF07|nr:hypothetical protein [uncultured Helicobacter sp.]
MSKQGGLWILLFVKSRIKVDCHSPKGLCDDDKNDIKLESMQTEVSVKNLNFES